MVWLSLFVLLLFVGLDGSITLCFGRSCLVICSLGDLFSYLVVLVLWFGCFLLLALSCYVVVCLLFAVWLFFYLFLPVVVALMLTLF